jgi:hypothetical protein
LLAYFYFEDKSCKSSAANLLTKDETQPLSANPAALQVTIDEPTSSEPAAVADSSCDHGPILPGSHSFDSTALRARSATCSRRPIRAFLARQSDASGRKTKKTKNMRAIAKFVATDFFAEVVRVV